MANSGSSSNSSSGSTNGSSSSSNSSTSSSTNTSNTSSNDTNTSNSSSDTSTQNTGSSSKSDSNASESSSGSSSSGSTTGPFNNDQTSNQQTDYSSQQGHQKFTKSGQHNNTNNSNEYNPGKPKVEGSEQAKLKDDVNNGAHKFSKLESLKYNNPVSGAVRGVKNGVNNVKSSVNTMKDFAKQKGLKNKLRFLRQSKHGQKIEQKLFKVVKFIIKFRHVGLIGVLVIALFNLLMLLIGFGQSFGETLHYYCPVGKDIDPGLTKSALYQQYCAHLLPSGMNLGFEDLNGHYLVQTGSGPCTLTSRANLYLRFFAKNNVSIYDYLFDETGDCAISEGVNGSVASNTSFMRAFYSHTGDAEEWANGSDFHNDVPEVITFLGSIGFPTSDVEATMGYIRSEDTFDEYTNSSSSDDWVFYAPTTVQGQGDMGPTIEEGSWIEINGVKATLKNVSLGNGYESDKAKMIELLEEHPCGLITRVDHDKHSILVTGYDASTDKFLVVDPAPRLNGGFEVPQDAGSGVGSQAKRSLSPGNWSVKHVSYIVEDTK